MKSLIIIPTVAAISLLSAANSHAISGGEAVALCKNEVTARYGDAAKLKVRRIRSGRVAKVAIRVRGVSEEPFTVQCQVDGEQTISLVDTRDNNVATR